MLRNVMLIGSTLLMLLLFVPGASAADPVQCTMDMASGEYYSTGAYLFGHQNIKTYTPEAIGHAVVYFYCLGFY